MINMIPRTARSFNPLDEVFEAKEVMEKYKQLQKEMRHLVSKALDAHEKLKSDQHISMCAVALLFHKELSRGYIQRVRVCFVDRQEGDDDYILKAKAERYFREHEDFKDSLKGFHIAAWQVVIGRSNVTLDKK